MFGLYRRRPSLDITYIVVQDGKAGCGGVDAVEVGELEIEEPVEVGELGVEEPVEVGELEIEEPVELGESVRKEPSVKPH